MILGQYKFEIINKLIAEGVENDNIIINNITGSYINSA